MSTSAPLLPPYDPSATSPLSTFLIINTKPPHYGISSAAMASPISPHLKKLHINYFSLRQQHQHHRIMGMGTTKYRTSRISFPAARTMKKLNGDRRDQYGAAAAPSGSGSNSSSTDSDEQDPPSIILIEQFYESINDGDAKKLGELISDDCYYEDEAFLDPFKGKKQVMEYLTQLSKSMGKNVKFIIDRTFHGLHHTVGVLWHLDWRKTEIPFTRGCGFFDCGNHGGKLVIEKAYILVESPLKPGMSAVSLLKTVSTTFDRFPVVAEKFLQFQHELIAWVVIIFNKFVKPFVLPLLLPVLIYYFNIWKLLWKHSRKLIGYVLRKIFFPFPF
ncbi:hypothetical protein H6P81_017985 [Aristolochia fimbriata]|uniref:SnoaL-like domain-containing protein n=1 Tax=Aristolochia fimbriata TaxID=158543 RepID=A0AAV7E163_ARIFI|nr:hypothetical protein H6P81_017985 [Aristolochia fimbriata]